MSEFFDWILLGACALFLALPSSVLLAGGLALLAAVFAAGWLAGARFGTVILAAMLSFQAMAAPPTADLYVNFEGVARNTTASPSITQMNLTTATPNPHQTP
jgi:hypothetical protein